MLLPCKKCPVCGSKNISRINKTLSFTVKDIGDVTCKDISVDECKDCDEIILDPVALEKIEEQINAIKEKLILV